jgi:hypothetical protein
MDDDHRFLEKRMGHKPYGDDAKIGENWFCIWLCGQI